MPSCVVKWCKNNTTAQKKCQGLTFHRFPTANQPWNNDWISIVRNCRGERQWLPSKTSVICSLHFDGSDLYTTKNGLRRVVTYAVPKKFLYEPSKIKKQPVERQMTSFLQTDCKQSSLETYTFIPSTDSLLQPSPIIIKKEDDFQKPLPEDSISHNLGFSLPQPTPMIIKKEDNFQKPFLECSISHSLDLSLAQPPPIIIKKEDDTQKPFPECSISHSLDLSVAQPPPIIIKIENDSQKPLPEGSISHSLGLSVSQPYSIIGPPLSPGVHNINKQELMYTPRNCHLRDKLQKKELLIEKHLKKIKILNQKIRRLQKRNKSLKGIIKALKNNK